MEWLPRWESLLFCARIEGWLTLWTAWKDGHSERVPLVAKLAIASRTAQRPVAVQESDGAEGLHPVDAPAEP